MLAAGWGRHGGIFVQADAGWRALRQHFRALLMIYDPAQRPLFFRYYDPRVLRIYLPICMPAELDTIFGPVARYLLEDQKSGMLLCYEQDHGELLTRQVALA